MPQLLYQWKIVRLFSFVPLSLTIVYRFPYRRIITSISGATRHPEIEISATKTEHLRVESSTIAER